MGEQIAGETCLLSLLGCEKSGLIFRKVIKFLVIWFLFSHFFFVKFYSCSFMRGMLKKIQHSAHKIII